MSINNVEIQDSVGNVYYPHTDASVVKYGDTDVGSALSEIVNSARAQYTVTANVTTLSETWLTMAWSSKIFDNNSFITTDNTKLTINKSGLYAVSLIIEFDTSPTGIRTLSVGKTSGEIIAYNNRVASTYGKTYCSTSGIGYFNAGEQLLVSVFQNSGSNLDIRKETSGLPKLTIARIGGVA